LNSLSYAIFGGSFDPPHLGHKEIIDKTLQIADRVVVVPTFLNPFKESYNISPQKRLELSKIVFESKKVIVSDFEIKNQRPTYTIETFDQLSREYNIKYIVIGADNLKDISKWREFERLNSKITWLVATRKGEKIDCCLLKKCIILDADVDVSSTEIRNGKKLNFIDKKIEKKVIDEYRIRK
jgi:nicotinate-nucleotide adenylyltransferase